MQVNGEWFVATAIILFLNKADLFQEKIRRVPLTICFPDYKGDNSYNDAAKFIETKFREQSLNPAKQLFAHMTCATDTENVKFVFAATKTIILKDTLKSLDLL